MPAQIEDLIEKTDTAELVRDQIAAILKIESENQVRLARAAGPPRDPEDWALRIFIERAHPWELFRDTPEEDSGCCREAPIVNVWWDRSTFDGQRGDAVERQTASGYFNVDIYARGIAQGRSDDGHDSGDELASRDAQRAVRLVRNILMSGHYAYLGMRGVVGKRWPESIELHPADGERSAQQVASARVRMAVDFNEFSPQVKGQPLERITTEVRRDSVTGELLLTATTSFV